MLINNERYFEEIYIRNEDSTMEAYQGVAITDGINRKNHMIPLKTIINS